MKKAVIVAVIIIGAVSLRFTWDYLDKNSFKYESARIEKLTPYMELVAEVPPTSAWIWHGRIIAQDGPTFIIDCTGDGYSDFRVPVPLDRHYSVGEKVRGSVKFPFEDPNNDPPFITGKE